jgi:hypothetical protein
MSAPHPFADESLAAAEARLQTAADPLNPYAAPPGGQEYLPQAGPGRGIWRLGEQVVIHQALNFPERCIFTNEPQVRRWTLTLTYSAWYGLSHCTIKFDYSLSSAGCKKRSRELLRPLARFGCGTLLIVLPIFIFAIWDDGQSDVHYLFSWSVFAGFVVCLVSAFQFRWHWPAMHLVHHEGPYFVLSGPGPAFLRSLPNWPGIMSKQ